MLIWTDGGCIDNGKPNAVGAWAFVCDDGHEEFGCGEIGTTNNRMELEAVIYALRYAKAKNMQLVRIYTDSELTINCATKKWKRRSNLDLWSLFDAESKGLGVTFCWVKGHSGDKMNDRADALCTAAMAQGGPA
jgi:ribonuclease HI